MADEKKHSFSSKIKELKANFLGATVEVLLSEIKEPAPDLKRAIISVAAAAVAGGRKVATAKTITAFNVVSSYQPLCLNGRVNMRRLTVIGLALLATAEEEAQAIVRRKLGAVFPSEFAALNASTEQQKILKQAVLDSGLTDENAVTLADIFNM
jgi:hypothetical protein